MGAMPRRLIPVLLALVVVAITGAVVLLAGTRPTIPADAAQAPVARTVLHGEIAPDLTEGVDPATIPASPIGSECLKRIQRGEGWADLCWSAWRDPHDSDPAKDYYLLKVHGSFEGLRWLVVQSDLVGTPADNVFSAWPEGTFDGDCRQVDVHLIVLPAALPPEDLCGRTDGESSPAQAAHRVVWTCEGCLLPDGSTKAITLYNVVGVHAGTVPSWDIFADAGS